MSEDRTAQPWWVAGQKRPETADGSEPTRAEAFVAPPDVPLTVPDPPHAAEPGPAPHPPPPPPLPPPAPQQSPLPLPGWTLGEPVTSFPTAPLPVPSATAPRRRRRWPWFAAGAGVIVIGLVAGLLVWAPWIQPPGAPQTVLATSDTATSILVTWSASQGGATPDHYLVMRDGAQIASVPASSTSFTDNGLVPGSKHRYAIIATAGGRRSADSAKASVTTITPSPVGLSVAQTTWTTVTFHWTPSPLGPVPDEYEVYSGNSSVGTVPGSVDSYDITGLTPGGSYQYQVSAVWGHASSAPSAPLSASTMAPPLTGSAPIKVVTVTTPGGGASLSPGDHWNDTWQFTSSCLVTRCTLTADAQVAAPGFAVKTFTMTLRDSGGKYTGSAKARISMCGSVEVTNTVTLSVGPKGATANGAWPNWTGTMQVSSPYTTVGSEFCPYQSWTFDVTGTNG